jgi:ABC-type Na+ transport system ATPase subunit NatA
MHYTSFRIQNFKGIQDTTVNLRTVGGAHVFAFVGLNESGKTTVLEAIHSFSPDDATGELLGGEEGIGVPYAERVPRHRISDFTGNVSVEARLFVPDAERKSLAERLRRNHGVDVEGGLIPAELVFERYQKFENGDFKQSYFTLRTPISCKRTTQKKFRPLEGGEKTKVRDALYGATPDIAYFPTFVFDFPESFFVTDRGDAVDTFYKRTLQDILDFDGRGHTIEKDIVRRVRSEKHTVGWLSFLSLWSTADDREKIQHVMDRASAAVTSLVFGRWNKIFGEDVKGKEVQISYEVVEGKVKDDSGAWQSTNDHDVKVKFQIRDGTRRFSVNDRSLGFRWFFSFMLFTQFRVARSSGANRPILFLFDEPAANLHSAAQQKLIESFPEVAVQEHMLGYSTHSHYMIEPKWLEQTFIVTNRSDAPPNSILDEISLDDESLDIRVSTYRSFVDSNPSQTSYFQPILDRLNVVPSKFDIGKNSIILEGKSDYYLLRYASQLLGLKDLPLIPSIGAGTFSSLIAIHLGWNLKFLCLLDGDPKGEEEKARYHREFGVPEKVILSLSDLDPALKKIEDVLDETAKAKISSALGLSSSPSKKQIHAFFQERLASDNVVELGAGFKKTMRAVLKQLRDRLSELA